MSEAKKRRADPKAIKTFTCLGVELADQGSGQWAGDCPLCDARKHFYVNQESGLWDCKRCGESGNAITFLSRLTEDARVDEKRMRRLALDRDMPLQAIRIGMPFWFNDQCLMPAIAQNGLTHDFRRWNGKQTMSTAGCQATLFRGNAVTKEGERQRVWICEGEWDCMMMQWLLDECASKDVAIGVPGASTFKAGWEKQFKGKEVVFAYDADGAGDEGSWKAAQKTRPIAACTSFVRWPLESRTGYDLRDFIGETLDQGTEPDKILKALNGLCSDEHARDKETNDDRQAQKRPNKTLQEFKDEFSKWYYMTPSIDFAIEVCCTVISSTDVPGAPLWINMISTASSSKTTTVVQFAEHFRTLFRSNLRANELVSGFNAGPDPSLILKLKHNKVLIVKDLTEVLSLDHAQQQRIFSIMRGAYDGRVEDGYGNNVTRIYHDVHFSMLTCCTHAIFDNRQATFGERTLGMIMDPLPAEADRKAMRSIGEEPEADAAIAEVAAGYLDNNRIEHIRECPDFDDEIMEQIRCMAHLVASLRCEVSRDRFSGEVSYKPLPESGTRLCKQLAKFARCYAWTIGEEPVGPKTVEACEKIAISTAYGLNLDIVDAIMRAGGECDAATIEEELGIPRTSLFRRLENLEMIGAIHREKNSNKLGSGPKGSVFTPTEKIKRLWKGSKIGDE